MKLLFSYSIVALAVTCLVSCGKKTEAMQNDSVTTGVEVCEDSVFTDSVSSRGDNEVFDSRKTPSKTQVKSEGFGRCLESGCYCKEFKGRGQTCRNCGHAYKRHY